MADETTRQSEHLTHYGATAEQERELLKEAQVAAIASPASLGLAAFALPLFIWGAIYADFFADRARAVMFLIPLGLVYGGLTQYAAGMWAFRKHEPLLATLFSSFGAFWVSYAGLLWMQQARFLDLGADTETLFGLLFAGWAVFAIYMLIASARVNWALALMLLALAATFVVMAAGFFSGRGGILTFGGWLAMIAGVLCWYASAADAINTAFGRIVLPTRTMRWGAPLEPEYRRPELA
jgi:succinate-acetate transporter protein